MSLRVSIRMALWIALLAFTLTACSEPGTDERGQPETAPGEAAEAPVASPPGQAGRGSVKTAVREAASGGIASPSAPTARAPQGAMVSPIEGVVVPKNVELAVTRRRYVLYHVRTGDPARWVEWFSVRYPSGDGYRGWRFCSGADADDGSGMSRSWSKGGLGLLLNVQYQPRPEPPRLLIVIGTGKLNDCAHRE
ncbi:MAG: hypothetical protein ACRDH6_06530 [Actinomycetota bacterium]